MQSECLKCHCSNQSEKHFEKCVVDVFWDTMVGSVVVEKGGTMTRTATSLVICMSSQKKVFGLNTNHQLHSSRVSFSKKETLLICDHTSQDILKFFNWGEIM